MGRIFVTGDTHGDFFRIYQFCKENNTTKDDVMIVCGDAGINYYLNKTDKKLKDRLSNIPITFLIVHGNHEERAWNVPGYEFGEYKVCENCICGYTQKEYPNLIFVKDFQILQLNQKYYLFLGGAYSVDKFWRLKQGAQWFQSEQMPEEDMKIVLDMLSYIKKVDYVISHTCPYRYIPTEAFLPMVDQSTVDQKTEEFLGAVEALIEYTKWCCGHWHIDKIDERIRFLFYDIIELE